MPLHHWINHEKWYQRAAFTSPCVRKPTPSTHAHVLHWSNWRRRYQALAIFFRCNQRMPLDYQLQSCVLKMALLLLTQTPVSQFASVVFQLLVGPAGS
jgi:hypothetical protein